MKGIQGVIVHYAVVRKTRCINITGKYHSQAGDPIPHLLYYVGKVVNRKPYASLPSPILFACRHLQLLISLLLCVFKMTNEMQKGYN